MVVGLIGGRHGLETHERLLNTCNEVEDRGFEVTALTNMARWAVRLERGQNGAEDNVWTVCARKSRRGMLKEYPRRQPDRLEPPSDSLGAGRIFSCVINTLADP